MDDLAITCDEIIDTDAEAKSDDKETKLFQEILMKNKKYNCTGPPAFKSQRVEYQSNQKLLHHYQH